MGLFLPLLRFVSFAVSFVRAWSTLQLFLSLLLAGLANDLRLAIMVTICECTTPKRSGLKADIVAPEPRTLGYGFDDGPFCGHNRFYNFLASKQQKATMYFIGTNVMNFALEAQRAVADGHEICVHTWAHPSMMIVIKLVTGVAPTCWRPRAATSTTASASSRSSSGSRGFDAFDWEVGSNGVTEETVQSNYDNLVTKAGQGAFNSVGAIMLTRELNNYTMQTAMDNYPKLAGAFDFFAFVVMPISTSSSFVHPLFTTLVPHYLRPPFPRFRLSLHCTTAPSSFPPPLPSAPSSPPSTPFHSPRPFTAQRKKANDPDTQHLVPVGVAQNKTQPDQETNYTQPNFSACERFPSFRFGFRGGRLRGAGKAGSDGRELRAPLCASLRVVDVSAPLPLLPFDRVHSPFCASYRPRASVRVVATSRASTPLPPRVPPPPLLFPPSPSLLVCSSSHPLPLSAHRRVVHRAPRVVLFPRPFALFPLTRLLLLPGSGSGSGTGSGSGSQATGTGSAAGLRTPAFAVVVAMALGTGGVGVGAVRVGEVRILTTQKMEPTRA
ncbi:hypothetical protein DFH09DRAFT_1355043 [Mycena vulgaris]|nr:hypothetical protein DFH09DRAFT_1355043 [Mycena vulgaris]